LSARDACTVLSNAMDERHQQAHRDDDYSAEQHLDRMAKDGWTMCPECNDWLHDEDYAEGSGFCKCDVDPEEGRVKLSEKDL
jgi:hypothetical protein